MSTTVGGYPLPLNQSSLVTHPDQRVIDMKDQIFYINPAQTPLLTILNALGKNPCKTGLYQWMEDEYLRLAAGKAKILDLGHVDGAGAAKYYLLKLTLSRAIERQAFEQSGYIKCDGAKGANAGVLLDPAGTAQGASGFQNNLFKVAIHNADGTGVTRYAFVLSPNFYDAQTTEIKFDLDALAVGYPELKDTYTNPQAIINSKNEVFCIIDPTQGNETTDCDPSGWTGYDATAWYNFETMAPSAQASGWTQGSGLGGESVKRVRFRENITQIFKTSFSITGTAMEVQLYGGETEYTRKAARKAAEHKLAIERALMVNAGASGKNTTLTTFAGLGLGATTPSAGAEPLIHLKNGSYNTDYQWNWDSEVDPQDNLFNFYDIMQAILEDSDVANGGLLISPKMNTIIHKLAMQTDNAQMTIGPSESVFGVRFNTLRMPDGDIRFTIHRDVLRGPYEDYALWLDFSQMELRPLGSRDTKLFQDVGGKEIDGRVDYYLTETGFECRNDHRHAIIKLV